MLAVSQYADPEMSRGKFQREIADFRGLGREYGERGWFLAHSEFPEVLVVLASPKIKPPPIICGVLFDYTNYDAAPPSVQLVNPFTRRPYIQKELPTQLNRRVQGPPVALPEGFPGNVQIMGAQPLMQAHAPEDVPFLCLAGVREYHEHPAHTGDGWELHRAAGAGKLVRILEIINRYGVDPVRGYSVNLVPQVTFDPGEPPV